MVGDDDRRGQDALTTERIKIGADEHVIETKRITLITHDSTVPDVETSERFMIDPEQTIYHGERVKTLHARTLELLAKLFPNGKVEGSKGYTHALGLIDLSLKLIDQGVPIGWRYPETYLHPAQQAPLADVLIAITGPPPSV